MIKKEEFGKCLIKLHDQQKVQDNQYRFCGLAQSPDGSLYISDDSKSGILKLIYKGYEK
jgi:glucose/arabinose dehydrogenase